MSRQNKQKLELTWIGKEDRPKLEPRILLEDPSKSYLAARRVKPEAAPGGPGYPGDLFENRLIFGDNLLALKALEAEFTGKVKCVCIDPPYNTGSAFTHYDDGVEHSLWLSLMRDRIEILHRLLAHDGSMWVCIDDNECHYLKVLMDEVFGRGNFVASVVWNHSVQAKGYSGKFSVHHNYVFVYQKSPSFVLKDLSREDKHNINYSNPDNDPRGPWRSGDVRNSLVRPNLMYDIKTPGGKTIKHPPKGWRFSKTTYEAELASGKIVFSSDETRIIRKIYLADQEGRVPESIWFPDDAGTTRDANGEVRSVVDGEFFDTPKPEKLIERVYSLSTDPGDWVVDSFAGSGTAGAVAHKMGRRWIMVEFGEHCHTHIIPRLKKVIDGTDEGGVTEATGWKGGGGFRYYHLAPSLLEKDRWGNWVISKEYNAAMLAEALCKLEGFTYAPSDSVYWQHGHSTERDFIYVTTQPLTRDMLAKLSDEVGEDRTLLIMCKAFRGRAGGGAFPNLTVKKIPKAVMAKCEWGQDDYSLAIRSLPAPEPEAADDGEPAHASKKPKVLRGSRKAKTDEPGLFPSAAAMGDKGARR